MAKNPPATETTLEIAVGASRKSITWKNKEITWPDLVDRFRQTHRTAETYAAYMAAKKDRQDEIKDVGGFVGGRLAGGRRKKDAVLYRTVLALDFDYATPDTWPDYAAICGFACAVYSTHKHAPTAPRFRLIAPLSRHVDPEEYMALARRVADWVGMDAVDHTTFAPERLMYWPSTSSDGEYFFEEIAGPWLDVDAVLATYIDWRDSSEWPTAPRESEVVARMAKKQGDPHSKPGIVGAFCRTYGIAEVIEKYLSDRYTATDQDNRYTFAEGSTAGGLVVYDDKYAYSHHSTDPISGRLCNAFDLVRLHMFGLRDEDADSDTPVNRLPSYTAMAELATQDPAVRSTVASEKLASALVDFDGSMAGLGDLDKAGEVVALDGIDRGGGDHLAGALAGAPLPGESEADGEIDEDWTKKLDIDQNQNFRTTYENIILILKNDPNLRGRFALNEFTQREVVTGVLPWRTNYQAQPYLSNIDLVGLRVYLEGVYGIASATKIAEALTYITHERRFHPVRDYLGRVQWDGIPRVDRLLVDYLGAEDTPYIRAVTRKTLAAAVARIMRPGIKFDYVLTLVGRQGAGKSTFIKKLGAPWYCENLTTVQGKEAAEQLHGVWIMEMGELAGLKKADVEHIKNFISRTDDSFRPAYAEKKETYLRQCVFIGTTNNEDFLRDQTGNRRFWPVMTGATEPGLDVHRDIDEETRAQIWAEAVELYRAGEPLYLDRELETVAREVQDRHNERDDREGKVAEYLDMDFPEDWLYRRAPDRRAWLAEVPEMREAGEVIRRNFVSGAEIWVECFGRDLADFNLHNSRQINDIMRRIGGWEKAPNPLDRGPGYGRQRCFKRIGSKLVKSAPGKQAKNL